MICGVSVRGGSRRFDTASLSLGNATASFQRGFSKVSGLLFFCIQPRIFLSGFYALSISVSEGLYLYACSQRSSIRNLPDVKRCAASETP